ncbi:hypothetical protein [Mucilaginibacter segetis]|uniref:Uncharacterized protein n=1 Tax=Mucilaginibacter segetis TaxID=2793071 RepID=A0A934PQM4_9SPHI|nr:hypothetical protein [Mucilaginibacter segetis]MBK0378964.1 hypothetical protein [Mucilaginibacter segetis]
MSTTAQQKPKPVQLKVVRVNKERQTNTSNSLSVSKVFTISFSHLKKAYRAKVLKVIYSNTESIYKIALTSSINNGSQVHWLQRQDGKWEIVLGNSLNKKLIEAITNAINCLE